MPQDDHHKHFLALTDVANRAVARSIQSHRHLEAETRKRIDLSRKLLRETAAMVEGYKPTKR